MRRLLSVLALGIVGMPWGLVSPAAAPQIPTFSSRTELVALEVSVMDQQRRPVRGLPRAAFKVYEDGKPQQIALFEEVSMPAPVVDRRPWANEVAADVQQNDHRATRLWVFILDDALIPTHPFAIRSSLSLARQFIDRLSPDDLAAVVFTADSRRAQDFTNDRARLLTTLDRFHPGWTDMKPPPEGFRMTPDVQFFAGVVATFRNVVDTLTSLPDQRKSIVWVSGGIDITQPEAITVLEGMKPVFENARRANVPIYAIHPCGLMTEVDLGVDRCSASKMGVASMGGFAAMTGGRLIEGTNNYEGVLDPIFEENNSFYLVGYALPKTSEDGRLHRTEVRVDAPGVTVRTRSGYQSVKKGATTSSSADVLKRALASPLASADIPLRATAVPFGVADKRGAASVVVAVGLREKLFGESVVRPVTVNIGAFTTEGKQKGQTSTRTTITIPAGSSGDTDYEVLGRLDLPAGRVRLRIAVFDETSGKTATVMSDVSVPDFSAEAISTSGLVVSVSPRTAFGPPGFRLPLGVTPTTRREFATTDRVTAAMSVYQGVSANPQDAEVRIQVTNSQGAIVANEVRAVAAQLFVRQAAWHETPVTYAVPIASLQPGVYLLSITAKVGHNASRRDVEFTAK